MSGCPLLLSMASACLMLLQASCGRAPTQEVEEPGQREGLVTSARCAPPSGLTDLRLRNGTLADVRIVSFNGETLYLPTQWAEYMAARRLLGTRYGQIQSNIGRFAPDIMPGECPGIVHVANLSHSNPVLYLDLRPARAVNPPADAIHVSRHRQDTKEGVFNGPSTPEAVIAIPGGKLVMAVPLARELDVRSPQWAALRAFALSLAGWLRTSPSRRSELTHAPFTDQTI